MIPRPTPRPPYYSQRTLAWAVIAFLALSLLVQTIELFFFGNLLGQMGAAIAPSRHSFLMAVYIVLEVTAVGVVLLTGIGFSVWLMGSYRNLDALGGPPRRHSEIWAVLGFLVPFVNLFRPFQVVDETWRRSVPPMSERSSVVPWWFALFLGAGLLWILAVCSPILSAVGATLNIARVLALMADAVLAMMLVQEITRGQEERVVQAAQPPPGTPGRWRHLETIGAAGGAGGAGELELSVVAGADTGKVFPLIGAEIVIGRQDRNAAPPWGSIAVQEASVSRVHAVLNWNAEHNVYTIQHRSSTNLTVLNGKPLDQSVVPLSPGDHIRMGRLEMVVRVRSASSALWAGGTLSPAPPAGGPSEADRETQVLRPLELEPEAAPAQVPAAGSPMAAWLPNPPAAPPTEPPAARTPPPLRTLRLQAAAESGADFEAPANGAASGGRFAQVAAEAAETAAAPPAVPEMAVDVPAAEAPPAVPAPEPAPVIEPAPVAAPTPATPEAETAAAPVDPLMELLGRGEPALAAPAEPLRATVLDEADETAPVAAAEEVSATVVEEPAASPGPVEETPTRRKTRKGDHAASGTPRSLFGLHETAPAMTPPRIHPYPVPSPTVPKAAPTPGLLPHRERPTRPSPAGATGAPRLTPQIDVPQKAAAPAAAPEAAAPAESGSDSAKRTFYVPASQLTSMARAPEKLDSGFVLEIGAGSGNAERIPLDRSAVMLGRRDASGEPDPFRRIGLTDPYLPREHAVLLWDKTQRSYRLHLLENAMVTTRVLRAEALGERDYLVTYRQPFMLQSGDEIVAGDSRVRLLRETPGA